MARDAMDVCLRVLRETNKLKEGLTAIVSETYLVLKLFFNRSNTFWKIVKRKFLQQPTRHFKWATMPKETRNSLYRLNPACRSVFFR